jgi:hypothetical protein
MMYLVHSLFRGTLLTFKRQALAKLCAKWKLYEAQAFAIAYFMRRRYSCPGTDRIRFQEYSYSL